MSSQIVNYLQRQTSSLMNQIVVVLVWGCDIINFSIKDIMDLISYILIYKISILSIKVEILSIKIDILILLI